MRVLALLCLVLINPADAAAQLPSQPPLADSGVVIRAWMGDTELRGRLLQPLRPGADSVRYCRFPGPPCDLNPHPSQLGWLRPADLDHLHRQVGTRAVRGAVIGGVGMFALGLIGGLTLNGLCEFDCPSGTEIVLGSIIVGGLTGGSLGALIGSAFPRMERVF